MIRGRFGGLTLNCIALWCRLVQLSTISSKSQRQRASSDRDLPIFLLLALTDTNTSSASINVLSQVSCSASNKGSRPISDRYCLTSSPSASMPRVSSSIDSSLRTTSSSSSSKVSGSSSSSESSSSTSSG